MLDKEFKLIDKLTRFTNEHLSPDLIGPGDDCAVIGVGDKALVVSTDTMVEDVHFRRDWSSPEDIGYKLVTSSLSDLAAMGAKPAGMVLALQVSKTESSEFLERLYQGIALASKKYGAALLGGDTVQAKVLSLSATVFGECVGKPALRSAACQGDDLWISGQIGFAGAGLAILNNQLQLSSELAQKCLSAHRRPEARVALAQELVGSDLVHAMIDVSDGLIQDAGHLAEKSDVEVELDLEALRKVTASVDLEFGLLLSCGDDYEVLFSAPVSLRDRIAALEIEGVSCKRIGRVGGSGSLVNILVQPGQIVSAKAWLESQGISEGCAGYQHF